jgi:hypothetical protein
MTRFCRMAFIFACLWISVPSASSALDQEYPALEMFLGASAINGPFNGNRFTMPGVHISLALNPKKYLRLAAEFAAHYRNTDIQSNLSDEKVRLAEYQFLGGPEFVLRRKNKATPFAHTLFGIAARHYTIPSNDPQSPRAVLAVDYGFASALGGGVDIALSRRWALRAVQFDYLLTRLAHDQAQFSPIQDQLPDLKTWQHNYRFSFGVTVRLGNIP